MAQGFWQTVAAQTLGTVAAAAVTLFGTLYAVNVGAEQQREAQRQDYTLRQKSQQESYQAHEREMDTKMVEIAVGILVTDPKTTTDAPREWAVKVINHYSPVPVDDKTTKALVENKFDARFLPVFGGGPFGSIGGGPIGGGPVGGAPNPTDAGR